jgi:peptide/nickel transport system permease protein
MSGWRRLCANRGALGGLVCLTAVCAITVAAPTFAGPDPWAIVGRPFRPPTWAHPLGTDTLGRSVLAGLVYGARISLLIGIAAALISTVIGVLVGAVTAFYGGWIDDLLMRLTEFFQIVPAFILALVLVALFEPSVTAIVIAIGVVSWPAMARLVRAEFLSLRARDFVTAEHAMGAGDARIIVRTILPNALPVVIIYGSLLVATSILFESSLSFLGLGDPNHMSWGYMIGASRSVLQTAWWLPAVPGLGILVTVLSINLVGDGLNDALNPRAALPGAREPGSKDHVAKPVRSRNASPVSSGRRFQEEPR